MNGIVLRVYIRTAGDSAVYSSSLHAAPPLLPLRIASPYWAACMVLARFTRCTPRLPSAATGISVTGAYALCGLSACVTLTAVLSGGRDGRRCCSAVLEKRTAAAACYGWDLTVAAVGYAYMPGLVIFTRVLEQYGVADYRIYAPAAKHFAACATVRAAPFPVHANLWRPGPRCFHSRTCAAYSERDYVPWKEGWSLPPAFYALEDFCCLLCIW